MIASTAKEVRNLQSDSPEDLTDSTRERLEGVLGFGGCETDKLSSREGEGSGDENTAETLESTTESTWVVPSACTPVFAVQAALGTTAEYENERDDHEDDGGGELDQ